SYAHAQSDRAPHAAHMNKNLRAGFGLSFIIPCLLSSVVGCGDEPSTHEPPPPELSAELRADLQGSLDQAVAKVATTAAALHVPGKDGPWSGAAGVADIDGAVPMDPDDHFRAGSIVKTLIATAVLQEVERGALGLDDVLTDLLPEGVTTRVQHADNIQVRMLLGHRSGVPDWVTDHVH